MGGRYKPYPEYKDSGVEWLGEVPAHWDICASKRLIQSSAGGTLIKGSCADEQEDGLFPAFSASGQDVWLPDYRYEHPGLVLSAVGARCGKTFKADGKWGVVANTHCLIPLVGANRDFLWFLTNIENWWETGGSAQPFVLVSQTLNKPWVFPSIIEQTKIANFLDHETAKIDTLIEKQQQLIQLLKEKRQAVISHAVTKGLSSLNGGPNAKLRDSGVEWLGEVPEGWKLPKLLHRTSKIGDGLHSTPNYQDGTGFYFVNGNNLVDGRILIGATAKEVPDDDYKKHYIHLDKFSVLLSINGTVGNVARYDNESVILGKSAAYINCNNGLSPEYLMLYLQTCEVKHYYDLEVTGTTIFNLSLNSIRKLKICMPSPSEQSEIVQYCSAQKERYRELINKATSTIELMQERRSALISAAVTGKIDVRDWVAPPASQTNKEVAA